MVRVLLMVTTDESFSVLGGFPRFLADNGYDVEVSCSWGIQQQTHGYGPGVRMHALRMEREVSPARDLLSLIDAVKLIAGRRPRIIIAGTPKAGLLGMVASALLRIPRRVYVLHGLRLETEHGLKRSILLWLERVACTLATDVVAVSPSLRDKAVSLNISTLSKIIVLGSGSANGVDLGRFSMDCLPANIGEFTGPVVGYVGRVTGDKGLSMMASALQELASRGITGTLLVVGSNDASDSEVLRAELNATGWDVRHVGLVSNVPGYLSRMDILCLPSRREGFGNVIIEAAAMGVPTVGTSVTGIIDAVVDGVTGLLVADGEPAELADALCKLITDESRRLKMGAAAQDRVRREFLQEHVWELWLDHLRL